MAHHITVLMLIMIIELLLGISFGLIQKRTVKQFASNHPENYQIFSREEYVDRFNENKNFINARDFSNNILGLKYSLIIVKYEKSEVTSSDCYTLLGDRHKLKYQNGDWNTDVSLSSFLFWTPTYTTTVLIPLYFGFFFGLLIPGWSNTFLGLQMTLLSPMTVYLMISGMFWLFSLYMLPSWINLGKSQEERN